ncbi:MAG: hypothetical protein WCW52_12030 [Elusimicrobiales bacterium]|jgi:hypothetical protein
MKKTVLFIVIAVCCLGTARAEAKPSWGERAGGAIGSFVGQAVKGARAALAAAGGAVRSAGDWFGKKYPHVSEAAKEKSEEAKDGAVKGAKRAEEAAAEAGRSTARWARKEYPHVGEAVKEKYPEVKERVSSTVQTVVKEARTGVKAAQKSFKRDVK